MAIRLTQMQQADYELFLSIATQEYAADKVKNGTWPKEKALALSIAAFASLLPQQWQTKDHYLRKVDCDQETIGFVWYALQQEHEQIGGFLYQLYIHPPFRNNGYGFSIYREALSFQKILPITVRLHYSYLTLIYLTILRTSANKCPLPSHRQPPYPVVGDGRGYLQKGCSTPLKSFS